MKKYFLLLILAALLPMVANADESGKCGKNLTWTYYESTHTLVLTGSGAMTNYKLVWNESEEVINTPWKKYLGDIVSVSLPEELTSIGNYAFFGCNSLTSVTIPTSVTIIGECSFSDCTSLTAVYITDLEAWCNITFTSFDSNPLFFAHHIYLNGAEIKDLIIPNSVTSISDGAFSGCSGLTSVTIPNSVTAIGESVFSGCNGLTSVTIPNSVTAIGESVFSGCSSLTSVTIPNSVTSIGNCAFYQCGLTSVTIPNSVTSIGSSAFSGCSRLTSVTIPNSVTTIGDWTFSGCSGLTSVTIPNSVTTIGEGAFGGCSGLSSVTIPNSVTNIGDWTFSGCSGLTSVTIPNSVTSIGQSAFYGCYQLTTLTLPDNLMIIKKQTFQDCSSLQKLIIPASVQYIYQQAFSGCYALSEIVAQPKTPPFIYNDTFSNYNCTLKVPDAGKDAYLAHEIWKQFNKIQTLSGEDIETPKCATPTISYQNGKLVFSSATEGAVCKSTITDTDIASFTGNEVQLTATYNISVYATKTGYDNSDVATATLCWIDKEPVIDVTNVSQVPAQAVLIQNEGGVLTVQGLDDGQQVRVYGIDGTQAGAAVSSNGQATVGTNLKAGSVAIIKIGDKSVKVVVK